MTGISILQLIPSYVSTSTLLFLTAIADLHHGDEIVIEKETILLNLCTAPDHIAWDEAETIYEVLDTNGLDFLEINLANDKIIT